MITIIMNEDRFGSRSVAVEEPDVPRVDVVRLAGRGTLYIAAAKAYFMLTGLATYLVLPRVLSAEQFGLYSIAAGVASIINAVVITGTVQMVSRFVSQAETLAEAVKRKALQLQLLVGGGIAGGYVLLAPFIARALHDPRLTDYFRITAGITFSYSLYAVFLGTLNGRKQFGKQAILDFSYSTFKMLFVIGLAALGYAVVGALSGWLLASLTVLSLAAFMVGWPKPRGRVRVRDLLGFQSMVLVFILMVNALQKVDLLLIKALSSPDPKLASDMAGYYSAVMTIANVTWQSIIAITFVAFPLISESTFKAERETTRRYISHTVRFSLMIMALLSVLFSSHAEGLLGLIYTPEYLAGATALRIAPFGMLLFGLLYVLTTIITSSGRPHVSVMIGLLTLVLDAAGNGWLIPRHGLVGAALAVSMAMGVGTVLASFYVLQRYGALLPLRSVLRIGGAALVAYGVARLVSVDGLLMVAVLALQAVVYAGALLFTGEIGTEERAALYRILGRQRPDG
ncbi:MAG: hypothetical protein D6723_06815 [Acidobacteria bacterium]|nr:MAG: hypothetical protein D6723_06815 [Acidobacteriota bacterium]